MRRTGLYLLLATFFFTIGSFVEAQQRGKVHKIGYLTAGGSPTHPGFVAFRQGMHDFGYVDGKNAVIEFRSAEAKIDRIPELVAELVGLKLDVLVITAQPAVRAAKKATQTVPIVMVGSFDPVATGIIDSLAHPGGNFTGLTQLDRDLSGKRLELLKEANPRITRVGVLWNPDTPGPYQAFQEYEAAARSLKIQIQSLEVRSPNSDLGTVFKEATKERVNALITARNSVLDRHRKGIGDLAIKLKVASLCERSLYVENGCLMSYATNDEWSYRRAAYYVDKILKGAKPADLPVEQPTKFEFVINLKTAKQIGVTIPPNVLARANRVIR